MSRQIYCIEGNWNDTDEEAKQKGPLKNVESVRPMLELLEKLGYWHYRIRDCATSQELQYYLENEWVNCYEGSILYFATHGEPGKINLAGNNYVTLDQIATYLDVESETSCSGCYVHFSSCSVINTPQTSIDGFLDSTGASGVSGYNIDVDWIDELPAVALEMILFAKFRSMRVNFANENNYRKKLPLVKSDILRMFSDCGFEMHINGVE